MPAITVKIARDEQGQYSVGTDTADQEGQSIEGLMQLEQENEHKMPDGNMMQGQMPNEGAEGTGMQPATDLEDALTKARTLLAEPQTEQQAFAQA